MKLIRGRVEGLIVVYEAEPSAKVDEPRRLMFETAGVTVHVEHFPDNWRELPDDELLALRRRTSGELVLA